MAAFPRREDTSIGGDRLVRRNARTDSNQQEIVRVLRQYGCSVQPIHQVGQGVPDLLVGWQGQNYRSELKDGNKPPSKRRLTPDEKRWHLEWRGQVAIVTSIDDALKMLGGGV